MTGRGRSCRAGPKTRLARARQRRKSPPPSRSYSPLCRCKAPPDFYHPAVRRSRQGMAPDYSSPSPVDWFKFGRTKSEAGRTVKLTEACCAGTRGGARPTSRSNLATGMRPRVANYCRRCMGGRLPRVTRPNRGKGAASRCVRIEPLCRSARLMNRPKGAVYAFTSGSICDEHLARGLQFGREGWSRHCSLRRLFPRPLLVDAAYRERECRAGRISAAAQDRRQICRRAVGPSGPLGSNSLPACLGRAVPDCGKDQRDRGAEERGQKAGETDSAPAGAPRSTATKFILGLCFIPFIRLSALVLVCRAAEIAGGRAGGSCWRE